MKDKLEEINGMGYNFSLTCVGGCYRITISRTEWYADSLSYTKLPHWQGESLEEVVDQAYSYCNS